MQVAKWGNSLAVRLPAALVQDLGLKPGDEVEIVAHRAENDEIAKIEVTRKPSRKEIIEELRQYRDRLPAGFRFNRDEANER